MVTEDALRALASFRGEPVMVSLYLDIDGRRYPRITDVEPHLDQLFRDARGHAERRGRPVEAVDEQLGRIGERFRQGFDRSRIRGVAFFAAPGRFEVVEVPRSVRNQVVVDEAPALRQLEYLLDEFERFLLVLVDRQRARLFRFDLGELVERQELFDPVSPRVDGTDDGGLMASHVQAHVDEEARRHFRHAAEVTLRELQEWGADRVILGGPTQAVAEFEEALHPYARERVADRISISAQAPEAEVREAALRAEEAVERREEAELVERLREGLGTDHRSVAGLGDTLRALYERRVDVLVVSHGYEEPGWRCSSCGFLATRGSRCAVCEASMHEVDDVVGQAIDVALAARSGVEICENADLDVLGRIGATLRF